MADDDKPCITLIGPHPLKATRRPGLWMPAHRVLITDAKTHSDGFIDYLELQPQLKEAAAYEAFRRDRIDYNLRDGRIYFNKTIAGPEHMVIGLHALEEAMPELTDHLHYLETEDEDVHEVVRRYGELWRMTPRPHGADEMKTAARKAMVHIGTKMWYFLNAESGERFATEDAINTMRLLPAPDREAVASEIVDYHGKMNTKVPARPELRFLNASFTPQGTIDDIATDYAANREGPPLIDDFDDPEYILQVFRKTHGEKGITEEERLGICAEMRGKVQMLKGGHIDHGRLIMRADAPQRVQEFMKRYIAEMPTITSINIGNLIDRNSKRSASNGRREVYLAFTTNDGRIDVDLIRMQEWDVWYHLDEGGHNLETAHKKAFQFQHFQLNCSSLARLLGVKTEKLAPWELPEVYTGLNRQYHGKTINAHCFKRRYVYGKVTDKLEADDLGNPVFVDRAAALLGKHAASNMVVGRGRSAVVKENGRDVQVLMPCFNDGDEYFLMSPLGLPVKIRVADPTGCLFDYQRSFTEMQPIYDERLQKIFHASPNAYRIFVEAFRKKFAEIQQNYLQNPKHYYECLANPTRFTDTFLKTRHNAGDMYNYALDTSPGNFPYRGRMVLERIDDERRKERKLPPLMEEVNGLWKLP